MPAIDPRLASALEVQLADWRTTLSRGAERVGWKLGIGDRERIGDGPVIGHLTSATRLAPDATYARGQGAALHADAEVALLVGRNVDHEAGPDEARRAIAGFAAALELVDLADDDDAERIVATNVFHRAFALGAFQPDRPADTEGQLLVDGVVRAVAPAPSDFADGVCAVARLLGAIGERLQAGDRIITGSVVQAPVVPGDHVEADFGALGRVGLAIGAP